ncbi:MAG TPA: ABC transporter permease [Candidatus Acidoferrales bacterium]|nr:ABC transporter permease [Candidatus Acidoferrales bacterium]
MAPTTIIRPSAGWLRLDLRALWAYRDLAFFLFWRDVKVRYRQTALGILWAVAQPASMSLVFFLFFGKLSGVPSDGLPYPLFVFSGLLPWQLFAFALSESSHSLVANERLITKVFFPRLIIPLAASLVGLVDFFFGLLVFMGLLLYWQAPLAPTFWAFPFFVVLTLAAALSVGIWLSALNVQYRDVRHAVPFLIQLWLFLSPVAYPSSVVPDRWRWLYSLNPMCGVIEGQRWALLGQPAGPNAAITTAIVVIGALLISGLCYFRRIERRFADVI